MAKVQPSAKHGNRTHQLSTTDTKSEKMSRTLSRMESVSTSDPLADSDVMEKSLQGALRFI